MTESTDHLFRKHVYLPTLILICSTGTDLCLGCPRIADTYFPNCSYLSVQPSDVHQIRCGHPHKRRTCSVCVRPKQDEKDELVGCRRLEKRLTIREWTRSVFCVKVSNQSEATDCSKIDVTSCSSYFVLINGVKSAPRLN